MYIPVNYIHILPQLARYLRWHLNLDLHPYQETWSQHDAKLTETRIVTHICVLPKRLEHNLSISYRFCPGHVYGRAYGADLTAVWFQICGVLAELEACGLEPQCLWRNTSSDSYLIYVASPNSLDPKNRICVPRPIADEAPPRDSWRLTPDSVRDTSRTLSKLSWRWLQHQYYSIVMLVFESPSASSRIAKAWTFTDTNFIPPDSLRLSW